MCETTLTRNERKSKTSTDTDKCFHETEKKKSKQKDENEFSKIHQLILALLRIYVRYVFGPWIVCMKILYD